MKQIPHVGLGTANSHSDLFVGLAGLSKSGCLDWIKFARSRHSVLVETALADGICRVVLVSAKKQVGRVETSRVVAMVTNQLPGRNLPDPCRICRPVGIDVVTFDFQRPITGLSTTGQPFPTADLGLFDEPIQILKSVVTRQMPTIAAAVFLCSPPLSPKATATTDALTFNRASIGLTLTRTEGTRRPPTQVGGERLERAAALATGNSHAASMRKK